MSYTLARNLRVNKKTGVISGEFAESNVTYWNGRHCYSKSEDIYNNKERTRTPEEKYSRFIFDLMAGNLQGSLGKYKNLSFGINNYYEDFDFFCVKYPNDDPFILTYQKYKYVIEEILNSPKDYIVKLNSSYFLEKLNEKSYRYVGDESKACKFSLSDVPKIKRFFDSYNEAYIINLATKEKCLVKDFKIEKKLPLEIEKRYELHIPSGKGFDEVSKKMKNLGYAIESFSQKDLDEKTIIDFYNSQVNKILDTNYKLKSPPMFTFCESKKFNDGMEYSITVYPEIKKHRYAEKDRKNPGFYVSYNVECIDLKSEKSNTYSGKGFIIDHILDDENRTKQILLGYESQFIQDLSKEKEESEDIELER